MAGIFDLKANSLAGKPVSLKKFSGKVLLVVNTASNCGFTPQYQGLERLYEEYRDRGLEVLGFPCNQFGGQEPGTSDDIGAFCERNYGVTFPMFEKVDVNGEAAHPLFQHLTSAAPGLLGSRAIKWNFTKFLVDRQGNVLNRYAPQVLPEHLRADIEAALSNQAAGGA